MGLIQRIRALRDARVVHSDDGAARAGRAAETAVLDALRQRLRGSGWRVWHGVRVPWQGRRRELDLVIVSPERALVVELKNWSGTLALHGERVIQIRARTHELIDHGNLFDALDARADALVQWHAQRTRQRVSLESRLVFYNPRLQMEDEVLRRYGHLMMSASELVASMPKARPLGPLPIRPARREDALMGPTATSPDVPELLPRPWWRRIFGGGSRAPVAAPAPPSGSPHKSVFSREMEALCETLDGLGSWDVLRFHGGLVLSGDLRDLGPWIDAQGEEGGLRRIRVFDRGELSRVEVRVGRTLFSLFRSAEADRLALTTRSGELLDAPLGEGATLRFQPAGARDPVEIPLVHLESIEFGYARRMSGRRRG